VISRTAKIQGVCETGGVQGRSLEPFARRLTLCHGCSSRVLAARKGRSRSPADLAADSSERPNVGEARAVLSGPNVGRKLRLAYALPLAHGV
jgi:hypothetical protein